MTGKDFKIAIKRTGTPLTEVATGLGILLQSLYTYFRADDVKSGTIEKVAQVLGVPVGYFYGFDEAANVQQPTTDTPSIQSDAPAQSDAQTAIAALSKELDYFREQNARLTDALLRLTDRSDAKEKTAV